MSLKDFSFDIGLKEAIGLMILVSLVLLIGLRSYDMTKDKVVVDRGTTVEAQVPELTYFKTQLRVFQQQCLAADNTWLGFVRRPDYELHIEDASVCCLRTGGPEVDGQPAVNNCTITMRMWLRGDTIEKWIARGGTMKVPERITR